MHQLTAWLHLEQNIFRTGLSKVHTDTKGSQVPWCIYLSAHFIWRVYYRFRAEVSSIWLWSWFQLIPLCCHFVDSERITFPYGEVCPGVCCQAASGCDDSFEAAGHGFVVWVVVLFPYRCSLTFVGLHNFGIKQVYNLEPFFIYNLCSGIVWCVGVALIPLPFQPLLLDVVN